MLQQGVFLPRKISTQILHQKPPPRQHANPTGNRQPPAWNMDPVEKKHLPTKRYTPGSTNIAIGYSHPPKFDAIYQGKMRNFHVLSQFTGVYQLKDHQKQNATKLMHS